MTNFSYDVTTNTYPNGDIEQEVVRKIGDVHEIILRQIMRTQDAQIRGALIKLGWTPPAQSPDEPAYITHEMTGIYRAHQKEMTRAQMEALYPGNPENKHAKG